MTTRHTIFAVAATTILALVASAALGFWNTRRVFGNDAEVTHTYQVQSALAELIASLTNAETGQRGYLITDDAAYLGSYRRGADAVGGLLDMLARLTAADPGPQKARVEQLRRDTAEKLAELSLTIDVRRRDGFRAAQEIVRTNVGKRTMDRIRGTAAEMTRAEEALLRQRTAESRTSFRLAVASEAVTAAAGIVLVLAIAVVSLRRAIERDTNEQALRESARQARRAADEAEERASELAAVFDAIPDGIYVGDEHGIVRCNEPGLRMLGATSPQDLNQPADQISARFDIRWPQTGERLRREELLFVRASRGEAVTEEIMIRRPDSGDDIYVRASAAPIRRDGRIVGAVLVNTDITARRRLEARTQELLEREQRARADATLLAEASELLSASLDYEETLQSVARMALPRLGDSCVVTLVDDDGGERLAALAHVDRAEEPRLRELVEESLRTASVRGRRPPSYLGLPIAWRGQAMGTMAFERSDPERPREYAPDDQALGEELTRRAASAIENARLYRHARELNRMKDEFLATLSHELRTPMNAVLGWTRMLRAGVVRSDRVPGALEAVERNAVAQNRLIEDLLDVSRIVTGKFRLDVQPVDLRALIAAAIDVVQPAATAKELRIQTTFDPDAGPVVGDPQRLQQAVWNLLTNAVKFTPPLGRVRVDVARVGGGAEIVVSDSGEGITPSVLPYVFDRFRQGDSGTTRAHAGLGLGLAIVRHIVELHGGTVQAESAGEGQGATFRIRLPIGPSASIGEGREKAASPAAALSAADATTLDGLRVLIVEDDRDTREMTAYLMRQRGAAVTVAGSAREAIASLNERVPDVILSDIEMPGEDGYALLAQIRSRPAECGGLTPAIAMTAHARPEDGEKSFAAGYQAHLSAPVNLDELVATVAAVAGRARSVQTAE